MRDEYYEIQKIGIVASKLISRRSISSEMIKFTAKIPFIVHFIVNQHCSVCKILPTPPTPQEYKEGSMEDAKLNTEKHMYIMREAHVEENIFKLFSSNSTMHQFVI